MQLQVKPLESRGGGLQTQYLLNMALCAYLYTYTKDWKQYRTVKNVGPISLIKYLWKGYYATIYCLAHCFSAYTLMLFRSASGSKRIYIFKYLLLINLSYMETLVFYRGLIFYKLHKVESGLLNELVVHTFWPKLCLQINQQEGKQEG